MPMGLKSPAADAGICQWAYDLHTCCVCCQAQGRCEDGSLRFDLAGQLEVPSMIWAALLNPSAASISTGCPHLALSMGGRFQPPFCKISLSFEPVPQCVMMERWGCKLLVSGFFSQGKKVCILKNIFFLVMEHIVTRCR